MHGQVDVPDTGPVAIISTEYEILVVPPHSRLPYPKEEETRFLPMSYAHIILAGQIFVCRNVVTLPQALQPVDLHLLFRAVAYQPKTSSCRIILTRRGNPRGKYKQDNEYCKPRLRGIVLHSYLPLSAGRNPVSSTVYESKRGLQRRDRTGGEHSSRSTNRSPLDARPCPRRFNLFPDIEPHYSPEGTIA